MIGVPVRMQEQNIGHRLDLEFTEPARKRSRPARFIERYMDVLRHRLR